MTDSGGRLRTITREELQQAAAGLRQLAETRKPERMIPRTVTHPQLVKALRHEIAVAFKQGYEVEDIIALLGQQGINIEATTFRRYWRRAKQSRGRSIVIKPKAKPDSSELGAVEPNTTSRSR